MQFLESQDKVPEEVDRMHIRDNLKAVQVLWEGKGCGFGSGLTECTVSCPVPRPCPRGVLTSWSRR